MDFVQQVNAIMTNKTNISPFSTRAEEEIAEIEEDNASDEDLINEGNDIVLTNLNECLWECVNNPNFQWENDLLF